MSIEHILKNSNILNSVSPKVNCFTQDIFNRPEFRSSEHLYDMDIYKDDLRDWLIGVMRSHCALISISKTKPKDRNKDRMWLKSNSIIVNICEKTFSKLFKRENKSPFRVYTWLSSTIDSIGIREELFYLFESYYGSKNKGKSVFDKNASVVCSEEKWKKLFKVQNEEMYQLGRSGLTPNVQLNDKAQLIQQQLLIKKNVRNSVQRKKIDDKIKCAVFEIQNCNILLSDSDFDFQEAYNSVAYQSNFVYNYAKPITKLTAKKYGERSLNIDEKTRRAYNGFSSSIEHIFDHCRINCCDDCGFDIDNIFNLILISSVENSRQGHFAKKDFIDKVEEILRKNLLCKEELSLRLYAMAELAKEDCGKSCKCYKEFMKAIKIL